MLYFSHTYTTYMKKFLQVLKWIGLIVGIVIIGFVSIVFIRKDRTFEAPYPNIKASTDSAVIARGKYLVNGPAHCAHCHTPNDKMALVDKGEIVDMTGGHAFVLSPLGTLYSPNITSDPETGIGKNTDAEIARVLRYGVKRNGQALFDLMPFYDISDSDLTAIISYLRTLKPVKNKAPENDLTFVGKALYAFSIEPVGPKTTIKATINPDSTAEYGGYLANYVGNCVGCHTDRNLKTGKFTGEPFAGGLHLPCETDPSLMLVSPNITFDNETGRLSAWSEADFISRFRKGRYVKESMMPWGPYSRMSDLELKALYRYLKTVKPVKRDNGAVLVKTADL